jgi:hypothetical protein
LKVYYELYGGTICPDNNYCSNFDRKQPIHTCVAEANLVIAMPWRFCSGGFWQVSIHASYMDIMGQQANVR